jgi:hypothetical protein
MKIKVVRKWRCTFVKSKKQFRATANLQPEESSTFKVSATRLERANDVRMKALLIDVTTGLTFLFENMQIYRFM